MIVDRKKSVRQEYMEERKENVMADSEPSLAFYRSHCLQLPYLIFTPLILTITFMHFKCL